MWSAQPWAGSPEYPQHPTLRLMLCPQSLLCKALGCHGASKTWSLGGRGGGLGSSAGSVLMVLWSGTQGQRAPGPSRPVCKWGGTVAPPLRDWMWANGLGPDVSVA